MIDLFRQLKLDYKEYLLLFKSGYFVFLIAQVTV